MAQTLFTQNKNNIHIKNFHYSVHWKKLHIYSYCAWQMVHTYSIDFMAILAQEKCSHLPQTLHWAYIWFLGLLHPGISQRVLWAGGFSTQNILSHKCSISKGLWLEYFLLAPWHSKKELVFSYICVFVNKVIALLTCNEYRIPIAIGHQFYNLLIDKLAWKERNIYPNQGSEEFVDSTYTAVSHCINSHELNAL